MTLVILAAGMGSRFGGMKQITPLTDVGEFIIDFSVYDAMQAGFDRFIFIIKEENEALFEQTIGARLRKNGVSYEYAYQRQELPEGFTAPESRKKPWGTAHAVLCAKDKIRENFAVINSDDFYGRDAFQKLAAFLSHAEDKNGMGEYVMVGYYLKNTLSENGTVARGICTVEDGLLVRVVENTKLSRGADGQVANRPENEEPTPVSENAVVSMNCWGFTPSFLNGLDSLFIEGLTQNAKMLDKFEFYLPAAVQHLIDCQSAHVHVSETTSLWQGVTYKEDSEPFRLFIAKLKREGVYPSALWK